MTPLTPIPIMNPVVESSSSSSFASIQAQQMNAGVRIPKGKQSLLEIQTQEKERQAEEDFMKWWAAEEERMRLGGEGGAGGEASTASPSKRGRGSRSGGRGRGRGVGRGKDEGGSRGGSHNSGETRGRGFGQPSVST